MSPNDFCRGTGAWWWGTAVCLGWRTAMLRLRTSDTRTVLRGVRAGILDRLAGLTPTGLMLAATVALVCVFAPGSGRPRWWCAAVGLGASVLVALPWLAAAAVVGSLSSTQAEGVARVRGTRRTRPRHVGQPGQPRWHVECRRGTSLAHNTFRGRLGGGAAGRRCAGTANGGTPPRRGAAADPRGGGGGGACRNGDRTGHGCRRGDDPDTARPRRGA